jgi:quercetin 2,3-dioxygenase
METENTIRELQRVIPSVPASDGAGVKLRRSLGSGPTLRHDPFLMLDEFFSDDPSDYLAGFPSHPHRGFETVTYMLDGHMRHEDHLGNTGDLVPGAVQWMTAGRGIVHSEMPQQTEGRMRGFQLWINLPAREKMKQASYRDLGPEEIADVESAGGGRVRVIAGTLDVAGQPVSGPVNSSPAALSTDPLFADLRLAPGEQFEARVPDSRNTFLYLYDGSATIGAAQQSLPRHACGLLDRGDRVRVAAGDRGARVLLLAGKPLHEPVVQYGPFVMNSNSEIEQALEDYRLGRLTAL